MKQTKGQAIAAEKRRKEDNMIFEIHQYQKQVELMCNFKREPRFKFNNQLSRTKDVDHYPKVVSTHERKVNE